MSQKELNQQQPITEDVVMKTKTRRSPTNLWATVVMIVLGILAVVIILMAIIPKSYAIELPENQPNYLNIYQGSSTAKATLYKDVDEELYNAIWDAFNGSFKQSSLSALFQEQLTNDITYKYIGSNKSLSSITSENDYVLGLVYSNTQTLYKDGKAYVCDELKGNSQYTDGVVTFKKLWVTVNNDNGVTEVNIYVQRMTNETASQSNYAILQIITKGLQSELVNVLADAIQQKS